MVRSECKLSFIKAGAYKVSALLFLTFLLVNNVSASVLVIDSQVNVNEKRQPEIHQTGGGQTENQDNDSKIDIDNSSKSKRKAKSKTEFEFDADLILGTESYSEFYDKQLLGDNQLFLRRLKLGVELDRRFENDNKLSIEMEVVAESLIDGDDKGLESDISDFNIEYEFNNDLEVKFGQFKEPFGLERLASPMDLPTNERSLTTSTFAPGRNRGIQFGQKFKKWTWSIGYFKDRDNDEITAYTGRITKLFLFNDTKSNAHYIHLGFAATERHLNGVEFRHKESVSLFSGDNIARSERFNADKLSLQGLEFVWNYNNFSIQSEAMQELVTDVNGFDYNYSGYYVQSSWILGGDKLFTDYDKGRRKSLKSKSINSQTAKFKASKAEISGIWEWVVRVNQTDLQDNISGSLSGNQTTVLETGINYYLSESNILKLSVYQTKVEGEVVGGSDQGKAASLRWVYSL
ncbi:MAG: hypothetical protein HWE27_11870 [Gammaproteobacteria bacterium]|nr:hypothetical protein [Gammaproteobacteria bacterium]